ncbi:hypothetical protein H0H92_008814 [Tricholoma furcatifolium]|nr:hypothetical protein H0H92_008814 [Tricholoma furcatifolium]
MADHVSPPQDVTSNGDIEWTKETSTNGVSFEVGVPKGSSEAGKSDDAIVDSGQYEHEGPPIESISSTSHSAGVRSLEAAQDGEDIGELSAYKQVNDTQDSGVGVYLGDCTWRVHWPVDWAQDWHPTKGLGSHKTISRYRLRYIGATFSDYELSITVTPRGYHRYVFEDETGDTYTIRAWLPGDHSFDSILRSRLL